MKAKSKASEKILAPAGVHAARCIRVIDMGTQTETFKGKEKKMHQVQLAFELVDELYEFSADKGEEPFVMYKDYTLSISPKANLAKAITAWTGYKFTGGTDEEFDMSSLLNSPCQIQVVHGIGKASGKEYAIINAIMAPAKGVKTTRASNDVFMFSLEPDEFDPKQFEKFPDWLQEKISATDEFQALVDGVQEEEEEEEVEEEDVELDPEEVEEYEEEEEEEEIEEAPVAKKKAAAPAKFGSPAKKVAAAVPAKKVAAQAPAKKVATAPSKAAVPAKKGKSDKLPF